MASFFCHASVLESIALCEKIAGRKMHITYIENNRIADHKWWVSDTAKFQAHYPSWGLTKNMQDILQEIHDFNKPRWGTQVR